jgi:hypothetical protein
MASGKSWQAKFVFRIIICKFIIVILILRRPANPIRPGLGEEADVRFRTGG